MDFKGAVLVCAPHTDDAELGCGGTIAKLIEQGLDVHVVAFSDAADSLPPGSPPDRLIHEMQNSLAALGIGKGNIKNLRIPVRRFPQYRQDILDEMIKLRAAIKPSMVLIPSGQDVHQDHAVVHEEGLRAFRRSTILGYELPWNQITTVSTAFVALEQRHIERKLAALSCYSSQTELGRIYFSTEFIKGMAALRGVQAHTTYAESFEAIRVLM